MPSLTEYVSKVQPMLTQDNLRDQAKERWEPGTGPWSKEDELDQVDLVHLEALAEKCSTYSDMRGLLSGCVERLVGEVRRARRWPTPPDIKADYMYVEMEEEQP